MSPVQGGGSVWHPQFFLLKVVRTGTVPGKYWQQISV